jgi:hypothetical protein
MYRIRFQIGYPILCILSILFVIPLLACLRARINYTLGMTSAAGGTR